MLKPCGHRIEESHNIIIRFWARKWRVKEAEALRKIIETYEGK